MNGLKDMGGRTQGITSILASLLLIFTPMLNPRITKTLGIVLLILFIMMEVWRHHYGRARNKSA